VASPNAVGSVTTPGAVAGWASLNERIERLPVADLFTDAIAHAQKGFRVKQVVQGLWMKDAAILHQQPGFQDMFGTVPGSAMWSPTLPWRHRLNP
jgi:gamma-glutamyltranspeptidase / glutathione hydrolase